MRRSSIIAALVAVITGVTAVPSFASVTTDAQQAVALDVAGNTSAAYNLSMSILNQSIADPQVMLTAAKVPGFISGSETDGVKQQLPSSTAATVRCWYDENTFNFHAPGGANISSITKTVTWCGDNVIIHSASWGHRPWTFANACLSNQSNWHGWLNWPFSQHGGYYASAGVILPALGCVTYSPVKEVGLNVYADGGDIKWHT